MTSPNARVVFLYAWALSLSQVLEAALADASTLDGEKAPCVVMTPDVCALLMRAADPQSTKLLLQQQQQHAQQMQHAREKEQLLAQLQQRGLRGPSPEVGASSSRGLASPPPPPVALRGVEYRKFVHAVNARGRSANSSSSGVSAADWLAGQHAKAALASVLSPTK